MSTIGRTLSAASATAFLAVAGLSVVACDDLLSGDSITGSGELVTEAYDLADFTKVDVGHAFDAEIARADEFSVAVTVDDNTPSCRNRPMVRIYSNQYGKNETFHL